MLNRVQSAKFGYPHECILIAKDSIIRHRANTSATTEKLVPCTMRSADRCPRAVIYGNRDPVRISCRARRGIDSSIEEKERSKKKEKERNEKKMRQVFRVRASSRHPIKVHLRLSILD